MVNIGKSVGRNTSAAITLNGEPLGYAIGNALELKEVIEVLKGEGPDDLRELCLQLGAQMLMLGNIETDVEKGRAKLEAILKDGSALAKLRQLVVLQDGDPSVIDNSGLFEIAPLTHKVKATKEGYVYELNAESVGVSSLLTGAGRHTKDDELDYGAGIILEKKIGDYVKVGDVLATLYSSDEDKFEKAEEELQSAYSIKAEKPEKASIIHKII
jgi:pyrimidine-nucleoside phosphorylase